MDANDSFSKNNFDHSFKLVFLGNSSVGKTSIIYRFIENQFLSDVASTIGISFSSKIIPLGEKRIKLEIWDTAGQERFKNIAPLYYRKAGCVIITFEITSKDSFEECRYWVKEVEGKGNPFCLKYLVGNKLDRCLEREVNTEDAEKFALENGLIYMEVSAKEDQNIGKLFSRIAKLLYKRYKEHSISIKNNNILTIENKTKERGCCTGKN